MKNDFAIEPDESTHVNENIGRQEAIVWWEIKRITMVKVVSWNLLCEFSTLSRLFHNFNGFSFSSFALFALSPNTFLIQFITRINTQKPI